MMDCLLANTSARNREIGAKAPLSPALCHAQGDLIHATQSQRPENGKDAAGGVTEAAAGIANAAGAKSSKRKDQRFRPLCNERAFTIGVEPGGESLRLQRNRQRCQNVAIIIDQEMNYLMLLRF